ncbi:MAG TPA: hypothetical protein VD769_01975 [Gaiellaceae bacterium]|nr:hypothetical protein [Gaiellaceae bacterium]
MRPLLRTGSLAGRPVALRDVRLGVAVDALIDRPLARLVGLEVRCGDEAHRFLPFPACRVLPGRIAVESALVLLDRELDFYRGGGRALSGLRGQRVVAAGEELGTLADLLVDGTGEVVRILVATPQGEIEVDAGPELTIGNHALRRAV